MKRFCVVNTSLAAEKFVEGILPIAPVAGEWEGVRTLHLVGVDLLKGLRVDCEGRGYCRWGSRECTPCSCISRQSQTLTAWRQTPIHVMESRVERESNFLVCSLLYPFIRLMYRVHSFA